LSTRRCLPLTLGRKTHLVRPLLLLWLLDLVSFAFGTCDASTRRSLSSLLGWRRVLGFLSLLSLLGGLASRSLFSSFLFLHAGRLGECYSDLAFVEGWGEVVA
jgi:hypothetical protein